MWKETGVHKESHDFHTKLYKPHRWYVMDSVLASSAVDHGFEPRSGQTNY